VQYWELPGNLPLLEKMIFAEPIRIFFAFHVHLILTGFLLKKQSLVLTLSHNHPTQNLAFCFNGILPFSPMDPDLSRGNIVCFPGVTTHYGYFHSPVAGFSLLVFEVFDHTQRRATISGTPPDE
jgi:hypothetical protein